MNLKALTLGAVVFFAISACNKENNVQPEKSADAATSAKKVNDCPGAVLAWSGSISNTSPDGYIVANSIITDHQGNILTSGVYSGTIDVNAGSGEFNLTGRGAFVHKLSANGQFISAVSIPLPNLPSSLSYANEYTDINIDGAGNIYVTVRDGVMGHNTAQIIKTDNAGKLIYRVKFDNSTTQPLKSVVDTHGDIITLGGYDITYGNIDLDPGPGVAGISSTYKIGVYLQVLDPNGKLIAVKPCPVGGSTPRKLDIDRDNNIYALATTSFRAITYSTYFQVDKTGKFGVETSNAVDFALDSFGIVYRKTDVGFGYEFGQYTRGGKKVYSYPTEVDVFTCDRQGYLYSLSRGKLSGPDLLVALPLEQESGDIKIIPDNKGGVIVHSRQAFNKFTFTKYQSCN